MWQLVFFTVAISSSFAQQFEQQNCAEPNRSVIVELFEWRWDDIALECEKFLGPKGFCAVQVSPPNEHVLVKNDTYKRPWWERYQPVSYKTITRSGNEKDFNDMVKRCNNAKVRVYVEVVMNNMCHEIMTEEQSLWGSCFDTSTSSFPNVPYREQDFNSNKAVCPMWSSNVIEVKDCRLNGLLDLNHKSEWVQGRILEWLNRLIRAGVAGFHLSGAKYMWPDDLLAIFQKTDYLSMQWGFQEYLRPFIYTDVDDYDVNNIAKDYYKLGRVTEFKYGKQLSEVFRKANNRKISELMSLGDNWHNLMSGKHAVTFIDTHETQRHETRDVLTYDDPKNYKMAVAFMLAWNYGLPRVMSSYVFDHNNIKNSKHQGPPVIANTDTIKNVIVHSNNTCGNPVGTDWRCEHRWRQIYNMVEFHNVAGNETILHKHDDGNNLIAFSRGTKAFFFLNGANAQAVAITRDTGLPKGRYCDVISGSISDDKTSCIPATDSRLRIVDVDDTGNARFQIQDNDMDPMIAIHKESKLKE